jgi:hypothetical protein
MVMTFHDIFTRRPWQTLRSAVASNGAFVSRGREADRR